MILTLTGALAAGCGSHTGESESDSHSRTAVPPGALALVGDRAVTRAGLAAQIAASRRAYRAGGKPFPATGTPAYRRLRDVAVRLLVDRARLEVEAEALGIRVTDKEIERGLAEMKRESFGGSEARYQEALRRQGLTDADARAAIRVTRLAAALRGRDVEVPRVVYAEGFAPPNEG